MIAEARYLDLLKKMLTNQIYRDPPAGPHYLKGRPFNQQLREEGRDWPSSAHTMVGARRLDQLQAAVEHVLGEGVPGDLVETGVWRGGACILMAGILDIYRVTGRCVWVVDSFEGMPEPTDSRDRELGLERFNDLLAVSEDEVRSNFRRYDLLTDSVRFLAGWFEETLPTAPIDEIAVLRLDGDLMTSTMTVLENLYPRVSRSGIVVIDDYSLPVCEAAVAAFRSQNGITDPIHPIDGSSVWWSRGGEAPHVAKACS